MGKKSYVSFPGLVQIGNAKQRQRCQFFIERGPFEEAIRKTIFKKDIISRIKEAVGLRVVF